MFLDAVSNYGQRQKLKLGCALLQSDFVFDRHGKL